MGAPTIFDGIRRTVGEMAVPSVVGLGVVLVLKTVYGPQVAGLAFLGLAAIPLLAIYHSAKYWNKWYTLGFVVVGLVFWTSLPGVGQWFVPSGFVRASQGIELAFLFGVGWMLTSKVDWL